MIFSPQNLKDARSFTIFAHALILVWASYFIGFEIFSHALSYTKWLLLLSLLGVFLGMRYTQKKFSDTVINAIIIFCLGFFIYKNIKILGHNFLLTLPVIILVNKYLYENLGRVFRFVKIDLFQNLLICNLILIVAVISVEQLSNWSTLALIVAKYNFIGISCAITLFILIYWYLFRRNDLNIQSPTQKKKIYYLYLLFASCIFIWISLRHDSLFELSISGSPLYHWEYFVGVISSIRDGGVLLWSTPSQYGFLNILITSLIPLQSPWHSFYIFQSILLFLVAIFAFITACKLSAGTHLNYLFNFLLIFLAIFFADSTFIGPYPFPSSSVVRFFGVYLLLFGVYNYSKVGKRQLVYLAFIFPLAVLWSAESAFYSISIASFLVVSLWLMNDFRNLKIYGAVLLASLVLPMLGIAAFYKMRWGHYPDIYSFFEYVVGYAKGFGYIDFPPFGPGNLLLLLFIAIIYIYSNRLSEGLEERGNLDLAPLMVSAASIWGVSSYYVGRPVAQNITAMIPILVLASYFALIREEKNASKYSLWPLKLVLLPFLFIVFATLINPDFYRQIVKVESFSNDIDTKKPRLGNEIYLALKEARLSGFSVIFYGDDNQSTAPYTKDQIYVGDKKDWLPIPLQLIEAPLGEGRRFKYLSRYICENKVSFGAVVMPTSDQLTKRYDIINNSIVQYYDLLSRQENYGYAVYKYKLKEKFECP
jgi:hypothetical protein